MKSLHVTSNGEQLYTVIHSPSGRVKVVHKHAIVICSPVTNEHGTCYWAMRQLALRLSRLGFHVVRFDYFATGNSSGFSEQLSLQTCVQNIVDMGQFIVDNTRSEKLTYIGFRLGAALASMGSIRQSPDQLILWDPVISGKNFMIELANLHEQLLKNMKRADSYEDTLGREYLGYPYSANLIDELNRIQQDDMALPADTSLSILTSPDNTEQKHFIEKLKNNGLHFQHEETTNWPINSQDVNTLDSSFLPGQSINQICNILKACE